MNAGHPQLFGPAALGPVRLRNRIIKAAAFEGMSRGGVVSDALVDFHQVFAAGGVGLTTLAYGAVSPDGRGAPHEIVLGPAARPGPAWPGWPTPCTPRARPFRRRSATPGRSGSAG
jgi:2,4-dienoyl-CoA reductase-like NADH-dependent reductase (Old Yellow Enzyme family)